MHFIFSFIHKLLLSLYKLWVLRPFYRSVPGKGEPFMHSLISWETATHQVFVPVTLSPGGRKQQKSFGGATDIIFFPRKNQGRREYKLPWSSEFPQENGRSVALKMYQCFEPPKRQKQYNPVKILEGHKVLNTALQVEIWWLKFPGHTRHIGAF